MVITIDLDKSYLDNADFILRTCFPRRVILKSKHSETLALIVTDLLQDLWSSIHPILKAEGIDDLGQAQCYRTINCIAWNQVVPEFVGRPIQIVPREKGKTL
jgi:hypothetical protein